MKHMQTKKRSVWIPVAVVGGIAVVLLALLIVGTKLLAKNSSVTSPILLSDGSGYKMYELRNDDALLSYTVRLRNPTDEDMTFTLRAVLAQDAKSGYLASEDATVRAQDGAERFTLPKGQTKSFDIVLTAPHPKYGGAEAPSGALPQLYAVFSDGSEGKIETQSD